LTDTNGASPRLTLREYMQNATAVYYDIPYSWNASKLTYYPTSEYINLTVSKVTSDNSEIRLTLESNRFPKIELNLPANASTISDIYNINFNFTVTDAESSTLDCDIHLDAVLNQTNASVLNNTLTNFLIEGIGTGTHTWFINCTDTSAGFNISETRTFFVNDTLTPTIEFNPSTTSGTLNQSWIFVNITCSDANKDTVNLNWQGVNETFTYNQNNYYWKNKTYLPYGIYNFYGWCNDTLGNYAETTVRTVVLSDIPPTTYICVLDVGWNEENEMPYVAMGDV